jgi:ATP-binding cassette subfamily B protein RaxB
VNGLVLGVLSILVVWLAARMIMANTFSIGLLVAFIAYQTMFVQRVSALIDTAVALKMLGLHAERLADIALTAPEPLGEPRPTVARVPVGIEVRGLSFRYGANDRWVLEDVSFEVEAGEWVAIAGASGCGKTTLLKLLAGLLRPTSGTILANGEPLDRLGAESWRALIGVVMQDDSLFAGSIADNISFFAGDADRARVAACSHAASVHDDIVSMPMGYGTLIGDMGTVLSGGQKQRVLLARALYRQPGLLLLDEATSHLDVAREQAVNGALAEMSMTRIVVAQRPVTIAASDRVIVLDEGRIVSDRRQLHRDTGVVSQIASLQEHSSEPSGHRSHRDGTPRLLRADRGGDTAGRGAAANPHQPPDEDRGGPAVAGNERA